jgi:hypothetical protein
MITFDLEAVQLAVRYQRASVVQASLHHRGAKVFTSVHWPAFLSSRRSASKTDVRENRIERPAWM